MAIVAELSFCIECAYIYPKVINDALVTIHLRVIRYLDCFIMPFVTTVVGWVVYFATGKT